MNEEEVELQAPMGERPQTAQQPFSSRISDTVSEGSQVHTGSHLGETSIALSEKERVDPMKRRITFDDDDPGSDGSSRGLRKSKQARRKKKFRHRNSRSKQEKKSGMKLKRKATVLVSKRIIKEAKIRNMPLSQYIREQGLDLVETTVGPDRA